ncbi:patatin-like phospholipase family protein [Acrocarpospora catenulata]|uniref:patatin-like phospholipase family protein n=1 Tax=Acrocarpospora catenulata TaxID=2836182 RepID=UPI001BD9961B|nr:patatin-like phospholipase family protein [Acrocarpospora catenulata]
MGENWGQLRARLGELSSRPIPEPAPRLELPALPADGTAELGYRFGLVLAGGAAKGAYQVGAVECLVHHGIKLHAVAGTSIGALNGVVLASAPTLAEGMTRLVALWTTLTNQFGHNPDGGAQLQSRLVRLLGTRSELERLIEQAVDEQIMATGVPMRVAAFPVPPPLPKLAHLVLPPAAVGHLKLAQEAYNWVRGTLGIKSEIITLNGRSKEEITRAALASAALPFLFPPRSVGGRYYRDGMLGKTNTPIRALAEQDGCDIVLVVHLSPGEPVAPVEREGLTLLQIRPDDELVEGGPLGPLNGLLDFSPTNFQRLRSRGYGDMQRTLTELVQLLSTRDRSAAAAGFLADRMQRVLENRSRLWPQADPLLPLWTGEAPNEYSRAA